MSLEVANVSAVARVRDGVNHCSPVAVTRSLGLCILSRGVIGADALAPSTANSRKFNGVLKAENFVRVLLGHGLLLLLSSCLCAIQPKEQQERFNYGT